MIGRAVLALLAAWPLAAAAQSSNGGTASAPSSSSGQGQPPAAPAPNIWLPKTQAELSLLEKVRGQSAVMTVGAGQSATFGSLTITVRSCNVRPPDQIQDAAAFVDIVDSRAGAPSFHGWLLASEPSISMLESPIYDVRLTGCK